MVVNKGIGAAIPVFMPGLRHRPLRGSSVFIRTTARLNE
jgi:hypothetical protein